MKSFSPFQIRWKEPLGNTNKPYCYRWSFVLFGYSLRVHHWLGGKFQEPSLHLHNHPHDFISILLKGGYSNIYLDKRGRTQVNKIQAPYIWWAKAAAYHHLDVPEGGAWTLLLCGRPYNKWGFWVHNHHWRPLRYFSKFKI
jgi:hypothetical protein